MNVYPSIERINKALAEMADQEAAKYLSRLHDADIAWSKALLGGSDE